MKDSKDKEERISNLKNMINNVRNVDIEDSLEEDDVQDVFEINEENEDYEIVDANEMIKKLNEEDGINEPDKESLIIDDEFIYNPNNNSNEQHLEENSQINEEFIIQTKLEENNLEDEELEENDQQINYEDNEYISEQFDNVVHAKVGKIPIMAIVATIIGIIFIIIAIYLSTQLSTRVIDNVVSGESTTGIVIIAILGLFLISIGVYEIFGLKNPFEDFTKKMKNIEKSPKKISFKDEPKENIVKTNENNIEKNKILLNKEEYKIGEFDIEEYKEKSKPVSKLDDVKHETVEKFENDPNKDSVKPKEVEEKIEKPKLSKEEIEEREYQKAHLEGESIDDIFSDIEEIDDIPIVSVDSNEQIEGSSKKRD